jgi:hypothetical protein
VAGGRDEGSSEIVLFRAFCDEGNARSEVGTVEVFLSWEPEVYFEISFVKCGLLVQLMEQWYTFLSWKFDVFFLCAV